MLTRLSISNYALIRSLDISFPEGLIIITGETGAGKSILLGALSLLLGKRAENNIFQDPSRNCVVEAEFGSGDILRRVITPAGRSRAFYNDEPVNLGELNGISSRLIDIHAQHQHLLLTDPDYRLSVIDHFVGDLPLLDKYKEFHLRYGSLLSAVDALEKEIAEDEREMDYRRFQLDQLLEARLKEGELEELEEEQKRLANAEEIRTSLSSAAGLLDSGDRSMVQDLKQISALLSRAGSYLTSLEGMPERVDSCRIELDDIEREICARAEEVTVSPERLSEVEERMSMLYALMRKHDCSDMASLIACRDHLEEGMQASTEKTERLSALKQELEQADHLRKEAARQLSEKRKQGAGSLSAQLQQSIRTLEMPDACFTATVTDTGHLGPSGSDRLDFNFSANGSSMLCDIAKVASGGELSRVMLALKGLMARYTSLPTMIFDEIDTGVSGRIADRMGDMIGEMAQSMQIFAITHLPQIASKGGAHYLVHKEKDENGEMRTGIRRIEGEERIREVARMLSGAELTDAALENARQLLGMK